MRRAKAAAETRAAEAEATLQSVLKMTRTSLATTHGAARGGVWSWPRPAEPQHQLPVPAAARRPRGVRGAASRAGVAPPGTAARVNARVCALAAARALDADAAHAEALDAKAQGDSGDLGAVADAEMLEVSQFMRRKGAEIGAAQRAQAAALARGEAAARLRRRVCPIMYNYHRESLLCSCCLRLSCAHGIAAA